MNRLFCLLFICLFFISCREIHFASEEEDYGIVHSIDHSLHYETPQEKFVPPPTEQLFSVKDQGLDFIQLASADMGVLNLSEGRPIDVGSDSGKGESGFLPFPQDKPVLSSVDRPVESVGNVGTEKKEPPLVLSEQGKGEWIIPSIKSVQSGYPPSPGLVLDVEEAAEEFIPEDRITPKAEEGFIQLASADIGVLNLSEGRPVDVGSDSGRRESGSLPFPQDKPVLSSVDRPVESVGDIGTEKEDPPFVLSEQGKGEWIIPSIKNGPPGYPSPPVQALDVDRVNVPEELFIPRLLDILFIVDTSESMRKHLISFKKKFRGFLSYFSGFNWRLAITDADHGEHGFFLLNISTLKGRAMELERDGSLIDLYYLDRTVANYSRVFLDSISRHKSGEYQKWGPQGWENVGYCELPPYCQGGNEQPLKSLKAALSKNPDFFRKNADLVTVIISNSKERAGDYESGTQPEEVIEEFRNLYGEQKRFEVYGIIIPEGDTDCLERNNAGQFFAPEGDFSEKIARLSEITGGRIISICSNNYRELADSIFHSFGTGAD